MSIEWTQALIPIVSSCAMTIAAMPLFIGYFQMKKQGQAIREEGPKWHNIKAGTPTMGGLVFLIGSILTGIWVGAWQKQLTPTLFILLFVLALYGVIGFLDDFIKIFKKRNMGLNSKQKLIGQVLGGIIFYLVYRSEGYPGVLNFFGLACCISKCCQSDGWYRWISCWLRQHLFCSLRSDCLASASV